MATSVADTPAGFGPGVYRGEQEAAPATGFGPGVYRGAQGAAPTTAPAPATAAPTNGALAGAKSEVAPPYPLRNHAIAISSLPAHPILLNSANAPSLESFLHALLTPALQMIDTTFPKYWTTGSKKKSKPASAEVKLYRWEDNRADQTWFIRRSTHTNVPNPGTFTWAELDDALRVQHSVKEAEYTPDIYNLVEVAHWGPSEGLEASTVVEGFSEIDMRLIEMAHKLPSPLIPRVFAELVVSARTQDGGLIVVQSPVDLRKVPAAFYSNDRNRTEGSSLQKRKRTIIGEYVSIERARTVKDGVIEWTMGTASDAKGGLPQWLQRSQIGSAIAKDVGYVAGWLMKKRQTHSIGANANLREG